MKAERMWQKVLEEFPADAPADRIESTARVLEGMSYEPVLLLKTPGFLRMGRNDLEHEIGRVHEMTIKEMMAEGFSENANFNEFKGKHLQLLVYHYGLLCRLRTDDPTAWDIVNELYEDD
ncbi:hypothetical protein PDESU_01256 [Pontiella desulfatans]|uniref:Uncharacterized protein n=1 Tax=Pontiella desulfatans TaxID=2750659 RepID=A0A6C2TYH8_PONDE|nr:hypothetical protein [Pontiella desulfatans]VGO12702.1 hypothetical protein PDESU_01256 [Pontiella desulfatans]